MPPGFGVRAGGNDGPETDFDRRRQSSGAEKHAARKDQSGDPESKNLAGNAGNQGHYRFAPGISRAGDQGESGGNRCSLSGDGNSFR